MNPKRKVKTVTEITEFELTTDNIESILKEFLDYPDDVDFTWNIGQWVSLTVRITEEETTVEGEEK